MQGAHLWHDQRIAREGFGIAEAATGEARLRLRDWSLARDAQQGLRIVTAKLKGHAVTTGAAKLASEAGVHVAIVNGRHPQAITLGVCGKIGTYFPGQRLS